MMREIKFRAWDTVASKMRYPNLVGKYASGYTGWWTDDNDGSGHISTTELMQYTGLRDKNGKDVYEGDIVNCSRGCPHLVEWVQEHGGTFLGGMPAFYLSGLTPGYAWGDDEEIIGNIYENPNLLAVLEGEA